MTKPIALRATANTAKSPYKSPKRLEIKKAMLEKKAAKKGRKK